MIQFVYFDLDDTLLDHRHAERQGLADVCQHFDTHFAGVAVETVLETYHTQNVPLWRQYAAGDLEKDDLKRLRFERTLADLGIAGLDADSLNTVYLDCYARHWMLPDAARAAFHAVADRFPVGLLTNGFAEIQHAKLDRFPELRERANAVVISEEVGVMKPHPHIFAHAATLAQVPASNILYVGDSFTSDVQGALQAGWQVAWFTSNGASAPEDVFCFDHWERLTDWLLG